MRLKNRDALSRTPLYYASQLGKTEIVDRLLKTGACNVEDADADGWTCLFVASLYGNKDIVELLLKNEAKTEAKEKRYGWTPIFAATCKNHVEIVKMLLKEGADVHVKDNTGRTPLWIAVMLEHLEIIQELIKRGANINCTDEKGRTPAYIAVQMEKKQALQILIENNADLEIADQDRRTPLLLAQKLRHTEIEEILVAKGVSEGVEKNGPIVAQTLSQSTDEEVKHGSLKGVLEKTLKTAPQKIHCLTSTTTHVWGGTTDGSVFVWDLNGELVTHVEKLFPGQFGILDAVVVEDEVWFLTAGKDITITKLNPKLVGKPKKEGFDRKSIEIVKTLSTDDMEIGCLTKFEDKTVYAGSTFTNNSITIYSWQTKAPHTKKKHTLTVNESNEQIYKLCGDDSQSTKIHFTKDYLLIALNKFVFVFSHKYQYQGVFEEHKNRVTSVLDVKGKIWSSSRDSSICIWEVTGDKRTCLSTLEQAHEEQVNCLAVAGDDVVSGGADSKIKYRNAKTTQLNKEKERELPSQHNNYIECMHWVSKTKNLWVASLDKTLSIWS
uniref:Uncharacterized protein n=1 Tax=Arcella intermedia TaxID=1963864 RepID=A0A6B2L0Z3_9EUKA